MAQIAAEAYTVASIKAVEDPCILTGKGRYIAATSSCRGMLHAAFVRSPLAHGRVSRWTPQRPGPCRE